MKKSQNTAKNGKPLINRFNIMTVNNHSTNELTQTELDYTYWHSKDGWLVGFLNIWPDHLTQGHDLPELEVMLADLYEFYKEETETIHAA
jgi:hypothetical protein